VTDSQVDWLTYAEAAELLGLSLRTLKRRVEQGHIRPIHPPGGHPRITRREVEAYRAAAERMRVPIVDTRSHIGTH